jgi:hypothetical protein
LPEIVLPKLSGVAEAANEHRQPELAPFSPFFKSKWVPIYQREPILIFNPALSNYPENDTPHLIAVWQTANLVILPMPQS